MSEWYVYQADGDPLGPWRADILAQGIAANKVPRDAYVAQAGETEWRPVASIPSISEALEKFEASATQPVALVNLMTIPPQPIPPRETFRRDVTQSRQALKPAEIASFLEPAFAAPPLPKSMRPAAAEPVALATPEKLAEKREEKKSLDPKYQKLPIVIFGACVAFTVLLSIIALAAGTVSAQAPALSGSAEARTK